MGGRRRPILPAGRDVFATSPGAGARKPPDAGARKKRPARGPLPACRGAYGRDQAARRRPAAVSAPIAVMISSAAAGTGTGAGTSPAAPVPPADRVSAQV